MQCKWRRCSNEVTGGRKQIFCSRLCGIKQHTIDKRTKFKKRAVDMFGGKCSKCGYNKCLRALQFHHINPETKEFSLSGSGALKAWKRVEAELQKCVILCANCHAEEEELLVNSIAAENGYSSLSHKQASVGSSPTPATNFQCLRDTSPKEDQ